MQRKKEATIAATYERKRKREEGEGGKARGGEGEAMLGGGDKSSGEGQRSVEPTWAWYEGHEASSQLHFGIVNEPIRGIARPPLQVACAAPLHDLALRGRESDS